jgi:hypothetical protein
MAGKNPYVLRVSILTHVIAAVIYEEANLPDERAAVLANAKRDVRVLEPFLDDLPAVFFTVWFFYERTGDRENALRVARRSLDRSGSQLAANICVLDLYQLGRFEDALQCLDRPQQTDFSGDMMRVFVLAELPDGPRRALREFEKSTGSPPQIARHRTYLLLLLGQREQAVANLVKLSQPPGSQAKASAELELARGELSEEKFLAQAGTSRMARSDAHLYMGLFRLAGGDRVGARKHFHEGARPCWGYSNFWCQMFLTRLEKEPTTWPPWIPVKK